ncbi:MAG: pirin family protein [Pseudomonadota bacterium]
MSDLPAEAPQCTERDDAVLRVIAPRAKDLGGFSVRRVLPASQQPMIGPFIFVDEMGPADFAPGQGINVRPHPHIGLATVTYLFEGEILHRDSLGYTQAIQPSAVNLMTAGAGIVHSERTAEDRLRDGQQLHGMQIWMALPDAEQECEPAFDHYPADTLPRAEIDGVAITLVLGSAFGLRSPVTTRGVMTYAELQLPAGGAIELPDLHAERGLYLVSGDLQIGDCHLVAQSMGVLRPGTVRLTSDQGARVMLFAGEPVGKRHIWWNFVHSDPEQIEQAKTRWREQAFAPVPGESEFIPLPE